MALITRVARLFRADLHAVLDRIEEPGILLKQAVREMEEQQSQDERRAKYLANELTSMEKRRRELTDRIRQINEELDVCFSAGKPDIARILIRRRLEAERFDRLLGKKHEYLTEGMTQLQARLDENRTRLSTMRQKADLLNENEGAAPPEPATTLDILVTDEDVEVAYLREVQERREK
jgi:phage shock protein A